MSAADDVNEFPGAAPEELAEEDALEPANNASAEQQRRYTSAAARRKLEGIFKIKPYPSPEMCKKLSREVCCMSQKQVQNWFQNRRQRAKKSATQAANLATQNMLAPHPNQSYFHQNLMYIQPGAMSGQMMGSASAVPMVMPNGCTPPVPTVIYVHQPGQMMAHGQSVQGHMAGVQPMHAQVCSHSQYMQYAAASLPQHAYAPGAQAHFTSAAQPQFQHGLLSSTELTQN